MTIHNQVQPLMTIHNQVPLMTIHNQLPLMTIQLPLMTIHNQVLHSPRKGVGLPESPWPVYNHMPSPRRPASALPIPLSPRTPVTERH